MIPELQVRDRAFQVLLKLGTRFELDPCQGLTPVLGVYGQLDPAVCASGFTANLTPLYVETAVTMIDQVPAVEFSKTQRPGYEESLQSYWLYDMPTEVPCAT